MMMIENFKKQFVRMVQEHQGIILSICKLYYLQIEDQQDAKQEIILQLWKAYPKFRGDCKISTWVYKVSLNTLLALKRKEKSKISNGLDIGKAEMSKMTSPFPDDEIQQLKQIIGLLNYEDKALVILYLEGYTYKEIASALQISNTNVSTRINRIKTKLKKIYKVIENEIR